MSLIAMASSVALAEPASPADQGQACELLPQKELERIIGEPLKETKPSTPTTSPYKITQCYFVMNTPVNSVVLNVIRRGEGKGARDPMEFWAETFHRDNDWNKDADKEKREKGDKEKKNTGNAKSPAPVREGEEEEQKSKPLKVEGLGDEAYWTGNAIGGALFVLKGHVYLRISVGGKSDQQFKIDRCKEIAQVALANLKP